MTKSLEAPVRGSDANKLRPEDRPVHDWYRFVLSYPPHLVRDYLTRFGLSERHRVLDPFCGTGTTIVECQKQGIPSVGVEANPMAHFASSVKIDWSPQPARLLRQAEEIAQATVESLESSGVDDDGLPLFGRAATRQLRSLNGSLRTLSPEQDKLLLSRSISPLPLHKTLVLLEYIRERHSKYEAHLLLALAKALVFSISNLHFGPEVGVGAEKPDAPVVSSWIEQVRRMAADLQGLEAPAENRATIHHADARETPALLDADSIDAVITSPPYPNEKDYTRTTRLESVLLGFIQGKKDLRALKKTLVRSNTRSVYRTDTDDAWVAKNTEIQRIAAAIEERRKELGKTSGFERQYHRVTKLYFGGMARHLDALTRVLRPGAQLAYVVGDQASYLRIMIRTGHLLADIAEQIGYKVVGIDLFRTRLATATRAQLNEEVVVLQWRGKRRAR